jgi:hypothetical protein
LIEHWGGSGWEIVTPAALPEGTRAWLTSVVSITPNDVYAAGYTAQDPSDGPWHALIEHWDGATWQVVPLNQRAFTVRLTGIAASGPNAVVAVGNYRKVDYQETGSYSAVWNGSRWSTERLVPDHSLQGVTAVSAQSFWAIGIRPGAVRTLTLAAHWDGASWSELGAPNPGSWANEMVGIAAVPGGSGEVWAVGARQDASTGPARTLILHRPES